MKHLIKIVKNFMKIQISKYVNISNSMIEDDGLTLRNDILARAFLYKNDYGKKSSEIDFELRNINIKSILEYSKDLESQILKMENYLKDYGFRSVIKDDSISCKF